MKGPEQLEMNIRSSLETAIQGIAGEAIKTVEEAFAENEGTVSPCCRSRHEAYGIAAEHIANITSSLKRTKGNLDILLTTLSDPNRPALDAASDVFGSLVHTAHNALIGAAKMKQAMNDLYDAETDHTAEIFPIEQPTEVAFGKAETIEGKNSDDE